jgi:hypothetical protein
LPERTVPTFHGLQLAFIVQLLSNDTPGGALQGSQKPRGLRAKSWNLALHYREKEEEGIQQFGPSNVNLSPILDIFFEVHVRDDLELPGDSGGTHF